MKKLSVLFCLSFFTLSLLHAQYSEEFKFNNNNWLVKNNTFPQPVAPNTWSNRGDFKFLGAENGGSIQSSLTGFISTIATTFGIKYTVETYAYMSVGYSEWDHDDAQMSNWLISPVIHNVKNGDIIQFDTKEWSKSNFEGFTSLVNLNADGIMSCERPNRLEVRFSTNTNAPNVGSSPESVGDFTIRLHVINDSLTGAYPQNWATRSFRVAGLPSGREFSGRIGFWYRFDNAGYNGCRGRRNYSDAEAIAEVVGDHLIGVAAEAAGDYAPLASAGLNAIKAGFNLIAASQLPQNGKNGTAIAIDNVKHIPEPAIKGSYRQGQPTFVWNHYGGPGNSFILGYEGFRGCGSSLVDWQEILTLKNVTNERMIIRLDKRFLGDNLEVTEYNNSTIQPGESFQFQIALRDSMVAKTGKGLLVIYDDQAESHLSQLATIRPNYEIKPPAPPIVKAIQAPLELTLNSFGKVPSSTNAHLFDAGSTNACGGTDGIWFSWKRLKDGPQGAFDCDDQGEQEVDFFVNQWIGSQVYSSSVKKKVRIIQPTPTVEPVEDQVYYLTANQKAIPDSLILRPVVNTDCGDEVSFDAVDSRGTYVSSELGIGPGTYDLTWLLSFGQAVFTQTSKLHVIDTISPIPNFLPPAIGMVQVIDNFAIIRSDIKHDDLGKATDNAGIWKYEFSTPHISNGNWVSAIPISCSDAGNQYPIKIKAFDYSGNTSVVEHNITILEPIQPRTRDITIELNPQTGYAFIKPEDLLMNGADGVCGITNAAVSKYQFNCEDVNTTVPVTVTYMATSIERSATANVTVREYSQVSTCADTVKLYVSGGFLEAFYTMRPLITSACGGQIPWSVESKGATKFVENGLVGEAVSRDFLPGTSQLTRTTVYNGQTFTCSQIVVVRDTLGPIIVTTPTDQDINLPRLEGCTKDYTIFNPFQQGSYTSWTYELTGATIETKTFKNTEYLYYQDRVKSFNLGITNVKIWAVDKAGNRAEVNYVMDLSAASLPVPYVAAAELESGVIAGDFEGETLQLPIESPMTIVCDQQGFMWYYEVRDGYLGNILDELDSIPQSSGTNLPLKIGPNLNHTYYRTVHFGYHDQTDGAKKLTSYKTVFVRDTTAVFECPDDVVIDNADNINYSYEYSLSPDNTLSAGSFWGYSVTGATVGMTTNDGSVTYTSNQGIALSEVTIDDAYPTLAADSVVSLILKNGINYIKLRYLKASGNLAECSYVVTIKDTSTPTMTCPPADTLYRTAEGSCLLTIGETCTQVNGFTGANGISGLRLLGDNDKVILRKDDAPASIEFSTTNKGVSYNDSYIEIPTNCSGTVSFTWTYKNPQPQFFRPFVVFYDADLDYYNNVDLTGFSQNITSEQIGIFSQSVNAGDKLWIGVKEGGANAGYLTISNFSAPHSIVSNAIAQPTFTAHPSLFFQSNIKMDYEIGNHTVKYSLINVNNGNRIECTQDLVVIDQFATALACVDTTVYLNEGGFVRISPDYLVNSCFSISATTLSKSDFDCSNIGVNVVTITSVNSAGDTLTCTANVTVLDQTAPTLVTQKINIDLSAANSVTLSDSLMLTYFKDNCKVQSVTTAQTTFDCDDVGSRVLTFTATDSTGNSTTASLVANIAPLGFVRNDPSTAIDVCVGEPLTLRASSGVLENYIDFNWQVKDLQDTTSGWDFYTCTASIEMIKNSSGHRIFHHDISANNNHVYMVYKENGSENLHFGKLNTTTERWEPVFKPITRTSAGVPGVTDSYFMDVAGSTIYVAFLDAEGIFKVYQWFVDRWMHVDTDIFGSHNLDLQSLYFNEGYFFATRYDGLVYYGKEQATSVDFSDRRGLYQGTDASIKFRSSQNMVILRDGNQNHVRELLVHASGALLGFDTLDTDPTGNSSLFSMASFHGVIHVAYKAVDGKLAVKKYVGNDTWTEVGSAISDGTIQLLDMKVVGGALYVVYSESGTIELRKWDGVSWEDMGSPNENAYVSGFTELTIYSINGDPAVMANTNSSWKLLKDTGWETLPNTSQTYTPNTNVPSDKAYRSIATEAGCAYTVSGTNRVIVRETPKLTMQDFARNGSGSVTLQAETTAGVINWLDPLDSSILSTGSQLTFNYLVQNETFYAFAQNSVCYSDTLSAQVFINDVEFREYNISYPDAICPDDQAIVELDTAVDGVVHRLFLRGENGLFEEPQYGYVTSGRQFYLYPSQTTTYKIQIEEEVLDAGQLTYGGQPTQEHLSYDTVQLDYSDEVTVEAWLRAPNASSATNAFGMLYHDASSFDPESDRNFEWAGGKFRVSNGTTARELAFPGLSGQFAPPVTNDPWWIHVATTAGPNGLKIYYNGNLVASSADVASGNINNQVATLSIGRHPNGDKLTGLSAVDEFRIWNYERSLEEIDATYDSCLSGNEDGLLIYTKFESYDLGTNTFLSNIGPDLVLKNQPESTNPQIFRSDYCGFDFASQKFLEPFTINVLEGLPYIVSIDDRWPSSGSSGEEGGEGPPPEEGGGATTPQLTCGGDTVTLNAEVSSGTIYWYNAYEGGDEIGSGSPFSIFIDQDTILYAGVDGRCSRYPVRIDVAGFPEIISASADTICLTDSPRYRDINFNIDYNDETEGWLFYDAPEGGNALNSIEDDRLSTDPFTGTDTLYVAAYNDYCESDTRIEVIIVGFKPVMNSLTPDTLICGPASITLSGDFENQYVSWYYGSWTDGSEYTTPSLAVGNHQIIVDSYKYYNNGNDYCYADREYVNVTVEAIPLRYDTVVTCGSYTWIDGNTYTATNSSILFNKESGVTCDSAIYLNLTIIDVVESSISASITNTCPGETVSFTVETTESGVDYSLVNNEDSVFAGPVAGTGGQITLTTGELQATEVFSVMGNKSVTVGSQSNSCDVQIGDAVTVNIGQTTSSRTAATCGDYSWNGSVFTESGTYYHTLTSSLGCDSIAQLNLTVFPEPIHTHTVEACDSYTWRGITYTESNNTAQWTGKTIYGCDSLVTLDLTIKQSVTNTTTATTCDVYEWNETIYTSSGSYMQTLTSSIGCDSTVTVQLTILESTSSDTSAVVCDSFDWYGTTFTNSGAYDRIITNSVGCDSTITLNLTINESTIGDTTAVACTSFSWYGNDFTSSGNYDRILTNSLGCDSTVTLHLTINEPTESDTTAASCGPFDWYGNNYSSNGDYIRVIENAAGCDSTITLHLTVNPASDPEYSSLNVETCYSYTFDGSELTASGTYEATLQNKMGCDSVVTLNLTLLEGKCWKGGSWVNGAPSTSDDVVIADTYTVTSELRVKDLQIVDGGTLSVPANGVLEIAGDISNSGSITLQSGSDFLSYSGNTVTGNDINFERNMRHETGAYSMMGSPVQQSADIKGSIAGITWAYDESKPYEALTNDGLKRWINWKNSELVPGHGYASANIEQLIFVGNPNVGTITVENLSYTPEGVDSTYAGWQLLANPYGTSIDVGAFLAANEDVIEGHINLWDDPNTGERGSNSDYMTLNAIGEVTSNPRGDRYNGHVLTGQGFFVKRLAEISGQANVVFTEAMRYTGYNEDAAYFRQTKKQMPKLWITMTDLDGRYSETLLGFPDNATSGVDHFYDAPRVVKSTGHQLYSILDKKAFAIQGLPLHDEIVVPLGYSRDTHGYVSINLKDASQLTEHYYITLRDNLKKVEYTFDNEAIDLMLEDRINQSRFALIFSKKDVLSSQALLNKILITRESSKIKVSTSKQMAMVKIVDLKGKTREIDLLNPNNSFFDEPAVKGVYIVYIQFIDGMTHTRKLIID